jgi:hypothetical protein
VPAEEKAWFMQRRGTLASVTLSLLMVCVASPANAAGTAWDPDDVGGRLDLRWVGVYREDADTVRVSISLWDPVRSWMLPRPDHWRHLMVRSEGFFDAGIYGEGFIFFSSERNRWVMEWIDAGSAGLVGRFRASHPNPNLFQVWLPTEHATAIAVWSCDHGRLGQLPSCSRDPSNPPQIVDWVPKDFFGGLDPV